MPNYFPPAAGSFDSPTFTGTTSAPAYAASGLTGATQASRYVGATTSGAPVSGTFAVGDYVIDRTGILWICTVAGSPGTWVGRVVTNGTVTNGSLIWDGANWVSATLTDANISAGAAIAKTKIAGTAVVQSDTFDPSAASYNGWLGQTDTLASMLPQNTGLLTSQRIYAMKLLCKTTAASATRTIWFYLNTQGSSLTSGQNLIAVYNSSGVQQGATSADQTTPFTSGTVGPLSCTVGSFGVSAGDILYVLILAVGGTTPKFAGAGAVGTTFFNANLATSTLRGSVQASSQTSMPGSITPASLSATNALFAWFALS